MKNNYKKIIAAMLLIAISIPVILWSKSSTPLVLEQGTSRPVDEPGVLALQNAYRKIAEVAMSAVVSIQAETVQKIEYRQNPFFDDEFFRRFFGYGPRSDEERQPRERKGRSYGTGFVISEDGYLISNHHVVKNAQKIIIQFKDDDKEYEAEVIGSDPDTDIALLKINTKKKLPALTLGDSETLRIGDIVVAIGNPFGLQFTYTSGVISATGRDYLQGGPKYQDFLQTDVAINPGNSGGPLLNIYGQVVGINSMIFSQTGGNIGIGFAIPINMAVNIVKQLKEDGKVVRGWLGVMINDVSSEQAEALGIKKSGVFVPEVQDSSPAQKAGVKAGDIIISYDGEDVEDSSDLAKKVGNTKPGQKVKLGIFRDGKEIKLDVKIAAPKDDSVAAPQEGTPGAEDELLGLALREESGRAGTDVIISEVTADSPFADKGVRPGDSIEMLDWQPVTSISRLKELLDERKRKDKLVFHIKRGSYLRLIIIKL